MSESLMLSVTADVMFYDGSQWIRPDIINGLQNIPDSQHLSNIQLVRSNADLVFRIIAIRNRDNKRLFNQHIFHRLKYKEATPSFHQWRNEHKQVIGLNFTNEQDAKMFHEAVKQVMDNIVPLMPTPQPSNSNNSMVQSQQQKTAPLVSVPPPPPPPPPPDLKSLLAGKHQNSLADKLKGVKLRKSSTGNGVPKRTVSPSNSVGSSNGSASVSSKFQSQDLISELSDRLSKRKMTVEASTSANGTQNRLNAQQTLPANNVKGASIIASYGRNPSVSSLSSQDEANVGGAGGTVGVVSSALSSMNKATNSQTSAEHNNNVNDETRAMAPITPNDLDRMKAELIEQFAKELQNLKRELTQTIRDEVNNMSGDRR
uniref:WH1 domain-containing protein n=1 Tax=Globodera rostochiensis TaxID=31243 RepID=A0A914I5P5_GLORO